MRLVLVSQLVLSCLSTSTSAAGGAPVLWPWQTYMSFPYRATVLSWEKKFGSPTTPGYLFFAPVVGNSLVDGFSAPTIMTDEGDLIWRSPSKYDGGAHNFDLQTINGTNYLSYWTGRPNAGYGTGYGAVTFLDETYTQVYNVCMSDVPIVQVPTYQPTGCILDPHESRITTRGTLLASVRNVTQANLTSVGGEENGWVLDCLFLEIDIPTQTVITRWSAYEHNDQINMFALSAKPLQPTTQQLPWDFFHMNSVFDVPDPLGGFIISTRYLSSVIKIDNKGDIEWYLDGANGGGNFTLPPAGEFSFQHCAMAHNVTAESFQLTLFNNNNKLNTYPPQESSGLDLTINLNNFTVTPYRRLLPHNATFSRQTGSYQSLPGNHVLVDYGQPPIFNEFDQNNRLIYTASAGVLTADVYRAYRRNFTAYPTYPPSVFAEQMDNNTSPVWVSWNGATEVATWKFAYGNSCTRVTSLPGVHVKTGFETMVSLPVVNTHVRAIAYAANGTLLGQSHLISTKNGSSVYGNTGC